MYQHITNVNTDLLQITTTIAERRLLFSEHLLSKQEIIHKVMLSDHPLGKQSWTPSPNIQQPTNVGYKSGNRPATKIYSRFVMDANQGQQ